jgi:hypothetical protein
MFTVGYNKPSGSTKLIHQALACAAVALSATSVAARDPDVQEVQGRQPQLAVDPAGSIHLTFGLDDTIFYLCSIGSGSSFHKPIQVGELQGLALGMRRGPRIAASGDTVVITAIGKSQSDFSKGNLYSWLSHDHGTTWEGPVRINDVDGSAREGLHAMAAGPKGEFYCTWLDLRNKGTEILGASSDGRRNRWSKNVLVYKSRDGTVCECCHPSVVFDASGRLSIMWRNLLGGNRDMYLTSSLDGGESYRPPKKLGQQSWPLKACPMDGGALAASASGEVFAIWRRENDIILSTSSDSNERRIGRGTQPWLATNKHGVYAVWLDRGKLLLAKSPDFHADIICDGARFPVVAAGAGVAVAWESNAGLKTVIKIQRMPAAINR